MKKILKSQQGYALILVLLTVVIIAILTPPLITSVMSSMKQNNITEENNQLLKTAEMGQKYFRKYIDEIEEQLNDELDTELNKVAALYADPVQRQLKLEQKREQLLGEFYSDVSQFFSSPNNYDDNLDNNVDSEHFDPVDLTFTLKGKNNDFQILFANKDTGDNVVEVKDKLAESYIGINYISIASSGKSGRNKSTLLEPLKIRFGGSESEEDLGDGIDNEIDDGLGEESGEEENTELPEIFGCPNPLNKSGFPIYSGNYTVYDVDPGNSGDFKNLDKLLIKGDLIVKGDLNVKNKTQIIVEGDASIEGKIIKNGNNKEGEKWGFICVEGNITFGK